MYMAALDNVRWYFLIILCIAGLYAAAISVSPKTTSREGFLDSLGGGNSDNSDSKNDGSSGGSGSGKNSNGETGLSAITSAHKQQENACSAKHDNIYESTGCRADQSATTNLKVWDLKGKGNTAGIKTLLKDMKSAVGKDILNTTLSVCMGRGQGTMPEDEQERLITQTETLTKLNDQIDIATKAIGSMSGWM